MIFFAIVGPGNHLSLSLSLSLVVVKLEEADDTMMSDLVAHAKKKRICLGFCSAVVLSEDWQAPKLSVVVCSSAAM